MVLICNNSILTIETFHKHRCIEKSDIRDVLFKMKHKIGEEFKERMKEEIESVERFEKIELISNSGTFKVNTKHYDCKKL